jgi:hypothetical protein
MFRDFLAKQRAGSRDQTASGLQRIADGVVHRTPQSPTARPTITTVTWLSASPL